MSDKLTLTRPWLVAVWPGMGHVALTAGYYLLAKLGMSAIAEYDAQDLFDVNDVDVKNGIIQPGRRPRSRFFLWTDPAGKRDLVVFLGEAQPPLGKEPFCRRLIEFAKEFRAERVVTFAAMATRMHPDQPSRVFGAATDEATLAELRRLDLSIVEDGQISGLNGVLVGAAAEAGLPGACLLGEMPHIFSQLPFPKASLAILNVFKTLADFELDLAELEEQARAVDEQLGELLERVEETTGQKLEPEAEEFNSEPAEEERVSSADRRHIETLFGKASADRAAAFELKRELDRLGVFKEYEDRFLDLFKSAG
jgi:proteasome assembly chaperone (PAC2) family protein